MRRFFRIFTAVIATLVLFCTTGTGTALAAGGFDRATFFQRLSDYMDVYYQGRNCLSESFYSSTGSLLGQTCHGYARRMTDYVFGTECGNGYAAGWTRYDASAGNSQIDRLSIGDIVRYQSTSSTDHTIFITAMYDSVIEYTDCNSDNKGTVKWNQTMSKSALAGKLTKPLVYDTGYGWIAHYTGSPFTPDSSIPVANSTQVILFEHSNFEGAFKVLEVGRYGNPASMGFGNDSLSSVKVGSKVKVKLGENDDFNGRTQTLNSSAVSLVGSSIGNDTVSSVEVAYATDSFQAQAYTNSGSPEPGPRQVILFEHTNYEGTYRILEIGTYSNPAAMGFGNDTLSSIKVGSDVRVLVGEHDGFNGRTQTFYSNVSSLVDSNIGNDTVSSVEVSWK